MRLSPPEHILAWFGQEPGAKPLIQPRIEAHHLLVAGEVQAPGEVRHALPARGIRLGEEHDLALGELAPVPGAFPVDKAEMDALGRELSPHEHGTGEFVDPDYRVL